MSCPGLWLGVGLKEMWVLGTLVTIVTPPFIRLAAADVDSWSPFPLTSSLPVSTEPRPTRRSSGPSPRHLCRDSFLRSGRSSSLCTCALASRNPQEDRGRPLALFAKGYCEGQGRLWAPTVLAVVGQEEISGRRWAQLLGSRQGWGCLIPGTV